MEASARRRSYWQSLNLGDKRVAIGGRIVIAALILLPVVGAFAAQMLWQVMEELTRVQFVDPGAASQIIYELRSVGFLFISVILLLCLLAIYFVFFLTVRVYGPQVALIRFIDQIKKGDYSPYRRLRRDDQLKEIWTALQELAAELKQQSQKHRQ